MSRQPKVQPAILELLEHSHSLSAPEIVELLSRGDVSVNKTSVYRALDTMLEQDLICKQSFGDETPVFELRSHHHDHLVCEVCGSVQVTDCLMHLPKTVDGFLIGHHHLTIYGLCEQCQRREHTMVQSRTKV